MKYTWNIRFFFRPPSRFKVTFLDNLVPHPDLTNFRIGSHGGRVPCQSNPYYAEVISNERVTSEDHFQEVRLVKFDIGNSSIR